MKILLLNGSPRKGNTYAALEAVTTGMSGIQGAEISRIDATKVSVSHCIACGYCKEHGKCVFNDDTNAVIDEIAESDVLVIATPVYWWGISAQLKLIIDKFYSQQQRLIDSEKKVCLIVIGQLPTDNAQYSIISKQVECICNHLGWDMVSFNAYSAYEKDDMKQNDAALHELENLRHKIV